MKIDEILNLIENKQITTEHFNTFIETTAKSAHEKVFRRSRLHKNEQDGNPETTAKRIVRTGDTDPTKTRRGKNAVKKRGEQNKLNANKFTEAVEFINSNQGKPLSECNLDQVQDLNKLKTLTIRLLTTKDHQNHSWLSDLYERL